MKINKMNHRDQVLKLLLKQVGNQGEVNEIRAAAEEVEKKWIDPLTTGSEQTNGLIYGLVQSGKTGVLTVTGAIGADNGYKTIIVLTSDIDPLYEQTMGRIQEAFPGMDILGKADIADPGPFIQRVKESTCVIVMTKNSALLKKLIENFKIGKLRGLTCLIIDDEADQASLDTKARSGVKPSSINGHIADLRKFFHKNTYLQVTATPQALFLQEGDHEFRPKFTVLSHPGADYVGGKDFFDDGSKLVTEFPLDDLTALSAGAQPSPSSKIPASLLQALDTFMIAGTYKRTQDAEHNCAFLCHVSTKTSDHKHIVEMLRQYKIDLAKDLKKGGIKVTTRLRKAYDDLARTHIGIKRSNFETLVSAIEFFSAGIAVKLVNGETDEDVAVKAPFNLFVGGNKLGRGVTIKNLLVSYYGRHPKTPQADTVLQHARMYGYRRKDIGLLRLFLPKKLHNVFQAINKMEQTLRELISSNPSEIFRGVYLENGLKATRKSVLVPGAVGVYGGGRSYNPAQVVRDATIIDKTKIIDKILAEVGDKTFVPMSPSDVKALLENITVDEAEAEYIWDAVAIGGAIDKYSKLNSDNVINVYVDRDRDLHESRRETQGILTGGEGKKVPDDHITLYIYRTTVKGKKQAAWWPQIRFPKGSYAFAFAI